MKSKKGSIVILALIGLVAVIVIAAAFFMYSKQNLTSNPPTVSNQTTTAIVDPETQAIEKVDAKTDDVITIQKDLNTTNFSTLDQDVLGVKTASDKL